MSEHGPRETAVDNDGRVYEFISGQWRPQQQAIGRVEAAMIGAGDTFAQLGLGAQQLLGIGDGTDDNAQAIAELSQEQPLAVGLGQALPFVATAPLSGGTLPGLAGVAGVDAALGGLMPGTPGERLQNAAFAGGGALVGGGILNAVNRVRKGIQDSSAAISTRANTITGDQFLPGSVGAGQTGFVSKQAGKPSVVREMFGRVNETVSGRGIDDPATLGMMRRGVELGIKFRPGAQSGGQVAQILNAGAERSLQFGDLFDDLIHRPNQAIVQKKVLKSLGSDADTFEPSTMGSIRDTLSNERTDIIKAAGDMGIDTKLIEDLDQVIFDYNKNVARVGKDDPIIAQVNNVLGELDKMAVLTPGDYARMREQLRKAHRGAMKTDTNHAASLQQTIDALDSHFKRQSGAALAARFHTNTQRFRMLKAIDGPGVVQPNSTISVPSLRRNLDKLFESEFTFNKAGDFGSSGEFIELFDTTKVLSHFKNIISDSGTVPAGELSQLFSNPVETAAKLSLRPVVRGLIERGQPTIADLQ